MRLPLPNRPSNRSWARFIVLVLELAYPSYASAQVLYDYSSQTPGSDVFAYDGENVAQLPSNATTPTRELSASEYVRIGTNDSQSHTYSVSSNNAFAQHRFVVFVDESEADVSQLDIRWTGRGENQNNGRMDGASLYVWNFDSSVYELLQTGADTQAEITLTGSLTSNLPAYLGGPAENSVSLLVVSNDRKTGNKKDSFLSTNYLALTVTALLSGPDHFVIDHDGTGVNCQPEMISVTALDLAGAPIPDYTGTIALDTQTTTGSWSLASGSGQFSDTTANDGLASYQFAPSDAGAASFLLTYQNGPPTFDIEVYDGASRDDDSEGMIVFAASAFTVTASALPNPPPNPINDPIDTQIAGAPFAIHLAAYGTTPSDPTCGIIETYDGDMPLRFWIDHGDPGAAPLVPTVDGTPIARSEALASDQTVAFNQGQAFVTAKYKDTGRISLHILDATSTTAGIRGATGNFVSQPADFVVIAVENAAGDSNPGIDTPTGTPFSRSGEPFSARLEARDAEGSRTPSYGRESSPEGIRLTSGSLVAPVGGRNGTVNDGTITNATSFNAIAPAGTFEGSIFAFDEVGSIRLQASVADGDFLGSGDVTGGLSDVVGRFAPSHFDVAVNTPRFDTACAIGAFTWLGQPFGFVGGDEPVLTVTALNTDGNRTANYAGSWWRLTNDSLSNRSYTSSDGTVDTNGLPNTTVDPAIVDNGDGTGTLTFSSGSGLALARANPVAPFDAELELAIDVLDLDGTAYPANPATIGGTGPGAGIAFDVSNRFQFGRLRFDNAFGSELVSLPMALRTQRFDGRAFVDDGSDSCTSLSAAALALTPSPVSLSTTPSIGNAPLLAGDSGLSLSAPNDDGTVDIVVDLSASGANLPWLRYDWPEDGNLDGLLDDDPRARATFGIWEGREQLIYLREIY